MGKTIIIQPHGAMKVNVSSLHTIDMNFSMAFERIGAHSEMNGHSLQTQCRSIFNNRIPFAFFHSLHIRRSHPSQIGE